MQLSHRRLITILGAFVVVSLAAPVRAETTELATQSAAATSKDVARRAPADEYFGPLKMSVLGVRNSLMASALRADGAANDTGDAMKNASLLEETVREWESKYPADNWLPGMLLALHRLYRKIATEESVARSVDVASWLIARYPATEEARLLRTELIQAMGR